MIGNKPDWHGVHNIHIQPQRRDATMSERNKTEQEDRGMSDALMALIRAGARTLIAKALEVEVPEFSATYSDLQ
jgi:hypothetical protein